MPKVDFYLLTRAQPQARERFACKLIEKVYRLGHRIYLHNADYPQAQAMDNLLWTFRQGSFVPHALIRTEEAEDAPVLIGCGGEPEVPLDLLINLDEAVPPFFARFQRVAEIVGPDKIERQAGRQRYRHYRERHCSLETHTLQG